ncbi:GcrA family cell cycle regulator [Microvirga calopogonii]|uniref:GcrA family cell cycle regulator n=1 Tax=Microvirga calopogonii TaxID=2078013 RepID=UPI000E0D0A94|nr:GcrA family cell cycle regulator [Microvirga calopogonii]
MTASWDKQRMEVLTRLWLAGETARMIAEKLGGGVTRNAVIGKAHRLGLTGKQGSKNAALKRARAFRPGVSDRQLQRRPKNRAR